MIHSRGDLEEREDRLLAPYAARSRATLARRFEEAPSKYRSPFQRDRDRIIHSTAFRRLEYKTQVFVNHEGDHYRTRLTHTLEAAQVSRSMARTLGLNEDLVESIALSHDLGHPPFGHAGEDALNELMEGCGGFNHNQQTLRVVDVLECRYPEFDGLNLCWEIRESIAKHGQEAPAAVDDEFQPRWQPLLEAQLADVADALVYNSHDIDDGLRSNILGFEDLRDVRLWRETEAAFGDRVAAGNPRVFTARMISHLIDRQVCDLVETSHRRLDGAGIDSLEKVRNHDGLLIGCSSAMRELVDELASFLSERLYRHHRTLKMAEKAKRFISRLFHEYRRQPRQLPEEYFRRVGAEGVQRVICDYVAGMTDRFCQDEYRRMFHPFERM